MSPRCKVCGIFQKDGWTVENRLNEEDPESFPPEYDLLKTLATDSWGTETLQCPECGRMYERTTAPRGAVMMPWKPGWSSGCGP